MPRSGPRREHDRDAFEALVLDAAEASVRDAGATGLGMRRIASTIGYAPNSIYNAIGDLDEIVRRLNLRTIARIHRRLQDLMAEQRSLRARILRLADGYLDFAAAEPHLWKLLFDHRTAMEAAEAERLPEILRQVVGLLDESLSPLMRDAADRKRTAVALWSGLHGLASLATSGHLDIVSRDDPRRLARVLIGGVLDGLTSARD